MEGKKATGNDDSLEPLLLPEEAAEILHLSTSWLAKARGRCAGPAYVQIGRAVRYSRSSLIKFIKEQTRTNTDADEQQTRNY
jgi:Helix-turn-helix domain